MIPFSVLDLAPITQVSDAAQAFRNTLELARHAAVTARTGIDVYFADPYSPYQRGSNENTNGLLRQYFPKKTPLSGYSQAYLDRVALSLNTRPRKTLGFKTPAQRLETVLQ